MRHEGLSTNTDTFNSFILFVVNKCLIHSSFHSGMRGVEREVFLDVKRGVEAKSYEDVSILEYIVAKTYRYSKMGKITIVPAKVFETCLVLYTALCMASMLSSII